MKQRIYSFDLLKLVACLAVVVIHATSDSVAAFGRIPTSQWQIGLLLGSFSYWAVPVFLAVSGGVTLISNNGSFLKSLNKRLIRLGVPLLIWIVIYALFNTWHRGDSPDVVDVLKRIIFDQPYEHLYFLFILLFWTPVLLLICKLVNKISGKELLMLSLITLLLGMRWDQSRFVGLYPVPYIGYFLLGAALVRNHAAILKHINKLIPLLPLSLIGIVGLIYALTELAFYRVILIDQFYFLTHFNPLIIAFTSGIIALVLIYENQIKRLVSANHLFRKVTQLTFGIYLSHPLILELVKMINPWQLGEGLHILFNIMLTLFLTVPLVAVLKKLPVLKYSV